MLVRYLMLIVLVWSWFSCACMVGFINDQEVKITDTLYNDEVITAAVWSAGMGLVTLFTAPVLLVCVYAGGLRKTGFGISLFLLSWNLVCFLPFYLNGNHLGFTFENVYAWSVITMSFHAVLVVYFAKIQ